MSFDRLGYKKPNLTWLSALHVLCNDHAGRLGKQFAGWAGIPVARLPHVTLIPSKDPVYGDRNPYHADLLLDEFRSRSQMESLAFHLGAEAYRYGLVDVQGKVRNVGHNVESGLLRRLFHRCVAAWHVFKG